MKADAIVEASKLKAEASLARVERHRAKSVDAQVLLSHYLSTLLLDV